MTSAAIDVPSASPRNPMTADERHAQRDVGGDRRDAHGDRRPGSAAGRRTSATRCGRLNTRQGPARRAAAPRPLRRCRRRRSGRARTAARRSAARARADRASPERSASASSRDPATRSSGSPARSPDGGVSRHGRAAPPWRSTRRRGRSAGTSGGTRRSSHDTAPVPWLVASSVLTNMLTCVAAMPMVPGPISITTSRSPRSRRIEDRLRSEILRAERRPLDRASGRGRRRARRSRWP